MTKTKNSKKILIIEDEGDMCLVLEMILHKNDFEIDHVKKIGEAAEYLKKSLPDLIVCDNCLPDGMGVEFIPDIKRLHPAIKIIMISGKDGSVKDSALQNGADLFLLKPFSRQELLEAVESLLNAEYYFSEDISV